MAFAILVKEIALLALLPWAWRAIRHRDATALRRIAATVIPYAAWCVWLRLRVGEFPFFAHTANRSDALSLPFVGIRDIVTRGPGPHDHHRDAPDHGRARRKRGLGGAARTSSAGSRRSSRCRRSASAYRPSASKVRRCGYS